MKNMTGAIYVAGALDYETRKRVSSNNVLLFVTLKIILLHFKGEILGKDLRLMIDHLPVLFIVFYQIQNLKNSS